MVIGQHGELDAGKAIEHVRQAAKSAMPELQFAKCNDIIENAAMHFMKRALSATSWPMAYAVFQVEKKLSGRTLIHPLEKVFGKRLPAVKPINAIEKAWDTFEKQYGLELKTNLGHAPDVVMNGTVYFTAVGWIIAMYLSQKTD